jgi:hypothetical protein
MHFKSESSRGWQKVSHEIRTIWLPQGHFALKRMLNDIAIGALAKGVNKNTLLALNTILAAAILSLLALLLVSIASYSFLVPHVCVLLVLAVLLTASINWFILSIGLVDSKEQEKELFGEQQPSEESKKEN